MPARKAVRNTALGPVASVPAVTGTTASDDAIAQELFDKLKQAAQKLTEARDARITASETLRSAEHFERDAATGYRVALEELDDELSAGNYDRYGERWDR